MSHSIVYSEELARKLQNFAFQEEKKITPDLLVLIDDISITGLNCYKWDHLQVLIQHKLKEIMQEYLQTEEIEKEPRFQNFCENLLKFESAPFTLQRICELLIKPKMYNKLDKYMNALEKLLFVDSVIPQLEPQEYNQIVKDLFQKKKLVDESNDDDDQQRLPHHSSDIQSEEDTTSPMEIDGEL